MANPAPADPPKVGFTPAVPVRVATACLVHQRELEEVPGARVFTCPCMCVRVCKNSHLPPVSFFERMCGNCNFTSMSMGISYTCHLICNVGVHPRVDAKAGACPPRGVLWVLFVFAV